MKTTDEKEKYKVSICPMCGHVRICLAEWQMESICYGDFQTDIKKERITDEFISIEVATSKHDSEHEFMLMNSEYVYFYEEEVKALTGEYKIKRPSNFWIDLNHLPDGINDSMPSFYNWEQEIFDEDFNGNI